MPSVAVVGFAVLQPDPEAPAALSSFQDLTVDVPTPRLDILDDYCHPNMEPLDWTSALVKVGLVVVPLDLSLELSLFGVDGVVGHRQYRKDAL